MLWSINMQWMVDEKELRVIHYTLGPLKPWDWWTSWLLKPVDVWQVLLSYSTSRFLWSYFSFQPVQTIVFLYAFSIFCIRSFTFGIHSCSWRGVMQNPLIIWLCCLLMLQKVREQLEETLPGTGGGRNPNDELIVKLLFLLPLFALLLNFYRSFVQVSRFFIIHSFTLRKYIIAYLELKAFYFGADKFIVQSH